MPEAVIDDLEWDEENETHVGRHIDPAIVDEFVAAGQWIQIRNRKWHPPNYVRLLGRYRD